MYLLRHTCATPHEDLALDEALLDWAERGADFDIPARSASKGETSAGRAGDGETPARRGSEALSDVVDREILRLWELPRPAVVVGRSSSVAAEVNLAECARRDVPVLRRSSGGAAVVAGPGCLMYSVVLGYRRRPALRAVDLAHRFVLGRVLEAVRPLVPGASHCGTSDLAVGGRKFSGNSLRCRREHLLYHGTLLYDFLLPSIGELLRIAPRQPAYRAGRDHREFVVNIAAERNALERGLQTAFTAEEPLPPKILDELLTESAELAKTKYRDPTWTAAVP